MNSFSLICLKSLEVFLTSSDFTYSEINSLKFLLDFGTMNITEINANTTTIDAEIKYGFISLWNETPEDKIAVTSVLFASLDVNQITARNKKTG